MLHTIETVSNSANVGLGVGAAWFKLSCSDVDFKRKMRCKHMLATHFPHSTGYVNRTPSAFSSYGRYALGIGWSVARPNVAAANPDVLRFIYHAPFR